MNGRVFEWPLKFCIFSIFCLFKNFRHYYIFVMAIFIHILPHRTVLRVRTPETSADEDVIQPWKIPAESSYVEISKSTSQESVIGLIVGFIVILIVIAVVVLIFLRRRQLALCGSNAEKGKISVIFYPRVVKLGLAQFYRNQWTGWYSNMSGARISGKSH